MQSPTNEKSKGRSGAARAAHLPSVGPQSGRSPSMLPSLNSAGQPGIFTLNDWFMVLWRQRLFWESMVLIQDLCLGAASGGE